MYIGDFDETIFYYWALSIQLMVKMMQLSDELDCLVACGFDWEGQLLQDLSLSYLDKQIYHVYPYI